MKQNCLYGLKSLASLRANMAEKAKKKAVKYTLMSKNSIHYQLSLFK